MELGLGSLLSDKPSDKKTNKLTWIIIIILLSQINEVEDEMRQILQEAASSKKSLEMRIKKLTNAFNEIQEDLAS